MFGLFAHYLLCFFLFFFFQAEDGIRDIGVTGVQTCALPILQWLRALLAVQRQVGAQPLHLCSRRCDVELAVERDDVPVAQVVAVVALGWIARDSAEVTEVAWRGTV